MRPKVELGTIYLICHSFGLVIAAKPERWRGGRVVECTGLENQHTFTGIGGSNPPPSANDPLTTPRLCEQPVEFRAQFNFEITLRDI